MAINCSFSDNEITELKTAGFGYKSITRYGTTFTPCALGETNVDHEAVQGRP